MTGKMGNKLCGCGLSLNKTLLGMFEFILALRVPVTYVAWLRGMCVGVGVGGGGGVGVGVVSLVQG